MHVETKGLGRAVVIALLSLSAASCTDDSSNDPRNPVLEIDGGGEVSFDPATETWVVDFGLVAPGVTALRTVRVWNGGAAALTIDGGAPGEPFGFDLPAGGLQLPPSGSAELHFTFAPQVVGETAEARVTLDTNERRGRASHRFLLSGRGATPGLDCEPGAIDLGAVVIGASRSMRTLCKNRLDVATKVLIGGFTGEGADGFEAQIVDDGAIVGEPFGIGPKGTVEIEIGFAAASQGESHASLPLLDGDGAPSELAHVDVTAAGVRSSFMLEADSCVDFGFVALGTSKKRLFDLRTLGAGPVVVDSVTVDDEAAAEFEISTPLPITVTQAASASVSVAFRPRTGGAKAATLTFHAEDGSTITGCATALGGGPQLVCTPESIDFGLSALDMPATRTLRCSNAGQALPGESLEPLFVNDVRTDSARFLADKASIRNSDGSTGARHEGYGAADSFRIDVSFVPENEGIASGTVTVQASPGGSVEIPVTGQGRDLPSCRFELLPNHLEFGVVDRGDKRTQSFTLRNTLQSGSCLVGSLRLADDSDGDFSIAPIDVVELPAGGLLRVPVTFAPTRYQPDMTGTVEFQVSNRDEPLQRVRLHGTAAKPCLDVSPRIVDFGEVAPGCRSRERMISFDNTCASPITVTGVWINENGESDAFDVKRRPSLPLVVNGGGSDPLTVVFAPPDAGSRSGTVRIEANGEVYLVELAGTGDPVPVQTDNLSQFDRPKVDILWVMDNSASSQPYRAAISQSLPSFLTTLDEQRVDYHIGVTTSGLTGSGSCPGGAGGAEDGRLFPVDGSHPRILTPSTPHILQHLQFNTDVGACNSDAQYYEAAKRALSEPLISSAKDARYPTSGYQDGNAGFLRRDAALAVIVFAARMDRADELGFSWMPADYLAFFKSIKRPLGPFTFHAISGGPTGQNSTCGAPAGDRVIFAVNETGGTWIDICGPATAWAAGMRQIARSVAIRGTPRFFLRGTPGDRTGDGLVNEADIDLRVDGMLTPPVSGSRTQVWTYDAGANSIEFAGLFVPAYGVQVTATYDVTCIDADR